MKTKFSVLIIALLIVISACKDEQKSEHSKPNLKEIAYEAFIYAYPMMEQVKTVNGMLQFMGAEFNKPTMNPKLPWENVGMPIVAPNLTSMTGGLFLDLSKQPVTIEIPDIKDRYNVFQCIDVFTHNFYYMGTRATNGNGGRYTFYTQDQTPPQNNTIPVLVEGDHAIIVVRIDIEDEEEHEKVLAIQNSIKVIEAAPEVATYAKYDEKKAYSPNFVEYLNELLNKVPNGEEKIFERFSKIGVFSDVKLSENELAMVQSGIDSAYSAIKEEVSNLQIGNGYIGATETFGTREFLNGNYLNRAVGASFGLWGNSKEEANYFMSFVEGKGKIVFKKEELPPLQDIGFWSITAHDENVLVHKNEYDSYVITMDKMKFEGDGSLIINFSSKPKGDNWLFTPENKMVIAIRVYQPNTEKIGSYIPPEFQRDEQ
jgi:hypothetical protein